MNHIYGSFFGPNGGVILTLIVVLFSFTTIVGWYYYQSKAIQYILGNKYFRYFNILFIIFVFLGAVSKIETVWSISSIANGLMALPNVIALLLLSPYIRKNKDY